MKYTIFWDKASLRPSPLMEKWWPNVCPWIRMDGHCFSCWIPVHGPCAPTQGFSKVLLRSNPNHPNGWRFTNENHPFTVRFPSLGLVQIPWRKNTEKTPNWSRKGSQWVGFTKKHLQNIRLENHLEMGHHWTSTGTKHLQKTHGPMAFIPSKELPLSPAHQQRSPGNSTGGCKRARHGQVTEPKLSKNHHLVLQNSPKLTKVRST